MTPVAILWFVALSFGGVHSQHRDAERGASPTLARATTQAIVVVGYELRWGHESGGCYGGEMLDPDLIELWVLDDSETLHYAGHGVHNGQSGCSGHSVGDYSSLYEECFVYQTSCGNNPLSPVVEAHQHGTHCPGPEQREARVEFGNESVGRENHEDSVENSPTG